MNYKHGIIGLLATLLAVGSAYAYALAPKPIYVRAVVTQNSPITCVATQRNCDDISQFACRVQVNVQVGANTTSSTYENSSCTVPLQDSTGDVKESPVFVYQLF